MTEGEKFEACKGTLVTNHFPVDSIHKKIEDTKNEVQTKEKAVEDTNSNMQSWRDTEPRDKIRKGRDNHTEGSAVIASEAEPL